MLPVLVIAALAVAPQTSASSCYRYVVLPGPEQGLADAALVRRAAKHDASPRSLGATLAARGWRIIWAKPDDSEPGVFFFQGARGSERLVDIWGGPTSDRNGAYRWALKIGAPNILAQCFADRLVTEGP